MQTDSEVKRWGGGGTIEKSVKKKSNILMIFNANFCHYYEKKRSCLIKRQKIIYFSTFRNM